MMDWRQFERYGRQIAEMGAAYHRGLRDRPIRPSTHPGDIQACIPANPPESGEEFEALLQDFETIVMPGMTHWQHPRFFAYFPANAAPPSILAEYLVSTLAAQCMLWQTSPAATELESAMLEWLRQATGLPQSFTGVIQDSASTATLAAVLTMRERALNWAGNREGLSGQSRLRVYASSEVHSSIDRAIWIAGIGGDNLVRIPIEGERRGMSPEALRAAVRQDLDAGFLPAGIIACTGATGVGACDDIAAVSNVATEFELYVHLDAAWAGAAMILPEARALWQGVNAVDSVVFNPHKWLGAQFDCTAHYLKAPNDLMRTLSTQPEYLKTYGADGIVDYSNMSIPLGRRFRALKIWFLLRSYGLSGLRNILGNHIRWAQALAKRLAREVDFEIASKPVLSLFAFRYVPAGCTDPDALNQALVERINADGRIYLTQTALDGRKVIRFQAGSFACEEHDVEMAFDVIVELARGLPSG